jgi:hypothetical protein
MFAARLLDSIARHERGHRVLCALADRRIARDAIDEALTRQRDICTKPPGAIPDPLDLWPAAVVE